MLLLHDAAARRWLSFQDPIQVFAVHALQDVLPALDEIERRVEEHGLHAAGFISYEAAAAFDSALVTHPPVAGLPLLWFGLFPPPQQVTLPPAPADLIRLDWMPTVNRPEYDQSIAAVKDAIARGLTYQVNYTYRLRAAYSGDPLAFFLQLAHAQPAGYAAYLEADDWALCSASPELFFTRQGQRLSSRPMKGTAPRGRTLAEDEAQSAWLHASEKNRAENVMIVDMLRNDLGRIARTGSVRVPQLFHTERYPTLWQMTSTVEADSDASFSQVLSSLFPCASITGAPKASTMCQIFALESTPRGVYTGCIGWLAPGRQAQFSVAIRTATLNRRLGTAEYGIGGGIVWDSTSAGEFEESLLKARLLSDRPADFSLLETMRWDPGQGVYLLEAHLGRLADSAVYFDFPLDLPHIKTHLETATHDLPAAPHRLRLLLDRQGHVEVEAAPLQPQLERLGLGLAAAPIDDGDPFLYHKTTRRALYDTALASCPGADDVILWNARRELTETCLGNLVLELDGELVTPPVSCGLLPGTARADLLAQERLRQRVITLDDLPRAQAIYRLNSVRGLQRAEV